jgi:uncharacterized membrane protein
MPIKISFAPLRLPLALLALTAIAILSSIARLVVLATTPDVEISQLELIDRRYALSPVLSWLHILPGLMFLLIGLVQFMPALRRAAPMAHRWLGRVFIVCGLISGVSLYWLVISLPAMGGMLTITGSWLFATGMIASLIIAWVAIRRRNIARHRAFMIRAYALGTAVATVRLLGAIGQAAAGMEFQEYFGVWLWLGMLLHFVGAELILRQQANRKLR